MNKEERKELNLFVNEKILRMSENGRTKALLDLVDAAGLEIDWETEIEHKKQKERLGNNYSIWVENQFKFNNLERNMIRYLSNDKKQMTDYIRACEERKRL